MLTVITPAESHDLATLAAVKSALGITGSAEDMTLAPLISRASAAISTYCNRVLIKETVREAFRGSPMIMVSRYPATVTSITEDGTALNATLYEADSFTGIIDRLSGRWGRSVVVTYDSGYISDHLPGEIVQALILTVAHWRSQAGRDPLLRAEQTTDIERLEWQVGGAEGLPGSAQALLDPHRAPAVF